MAIFRLGRHNLLTTSYDCEKTFISKYSRAKENMVILVQSGSTVMFNVDATMLHEDEQKKGESFISSCLYSSHTNAQLEFHIHELSYHSLDTRLFPGYVHCSTKGEVHGCKTVKNGKDVFTVLERKIHHRQPRPYSTAVLVL